MAVVAWQLARNSVIDALTAILAASSLPLAAFSVELCLACASRGAGWFASSRASIDTESYSQPELINHCGEVYT